jgi:hypothetical protein
MKLTELRALCFDPLGRAGFNCFRHLRNGHGSRQAKEQMNVIRYTTDSKRWAIVIPENGGEIGMQFRTNIRSQHRHAVLGTENQMDENAGKGL